MFVKEISSLTDSINKGTGKALGIAWLIKNDYNAPDGLYIELKRESYAYEKLVAKIGERIEEFCKTNESEFYIVRSSHTQEDGLIKSMAGAFRTISNLQPDEVISAINEVVSHSFSSSPNEPVTGVIVQRQIKSLIAGVLFTSNPINKKKKQAIVSATTLDGANLMTGKDAGNTYFIDSNEVKLISGTQDIPKKYLNDFVKYIESFRGSYQLPADIEWVIDENETVWFVQIRPITGIGPESNAYFDLGENFVDSIDEEKNNVRYLAKRFGLYASKGRQLKLSTDSKEKDISKLLTGFPSGCVVSVILHQSYQHIGLAKRTFGKFNTICEKIFKILEYFKDDYLEIQITLLEIISPEFSGIIKKEENAVIIDITKGHYLTKGVVASSSYVLDQSYNVLKNKEEMQHEHFLATENGQKKIREDVKLSFSQNQIGLIARSLAPLLDYFPCILEFGVMKDGKLLLMGYIKEKNTETARFALETGVISEGVIEGVLVIDKEDLTKNNSFNSHFECSENYDDDTTNGNIIIYATRASLNLKIYIKKYGANRIGFIFKEFSSLNHFCIRLRELNIPALFVDYDLSEFLGKEIILDARFSVMNSNERVRIVPFS